MKLITEEYRKLQKELHQNPNYGVASLHFLLFEIAFNTSILFIYQFLQCFRYKLF